MSMIQIVSRGRAEKLPRAARHFPRFLRALSTFFRTRLAAFSNQGAHWGLLNERLLRDAGVSLDDAESALLGSRMPLNKADTYDAVAGKGLRADQFMGIVTRQCYRRSV
jgi:hypothetical protein